LETSILSASKRENVAAALPLCILRSVLGLQIVGLPLAGMPPK
jgi:hypothetical protein